MATVYCNAGAADVHEEDRELVGKLARLQNLNTQLFELRTLLPERLISPIKQAVATHNGSRHALNPAILAAQLQKVAAQGTQELRTFKNDWHSEDMRVLRETAAAAQYPQGDDAWRSDYAILSSGVSLENQNSPIERAGSPYSAETTSEDVNSVLEAFRDRHPKIKIHDLQDSSDFGLDIHVNDIEFIVRKVETGHQGGYTASGKPNAMTSDFASQIYSFLDDKKPEAKLSDLLSLLASYEDVTTRSCTKCNHIFDDKFGLPVIKIRRNKQSVPEIQWSSFHRGCN